MRGCDNSGLKWILRNMSGRCLIYLFLSSSGHGNLELGKKTLNFAMGGYQILTSTITYGFSYQISRFFGTE